MILFVTGTSRGLGRFLKDWLRARGHTVVGCSRKPEPGSDDLALDVTDERACERVVQDIVARHGRLDGVVNNAGVHLLGAALEATPEELRTQMELNFFGCVNVMRATAPMMLAQRHGRIVNVGSVGSVVASPFASAYNASKFALDGYSAALRAELAPFGVHVATLTPGFIRTGTHGASVVPSRGEHALFTPFRKRVEQHMAAGGASGVRMERVATVVEHVLTTRRPRFRYAVDGLASRLAWLRALVPERLFEVLLVRATAPGFPVTAMDPPSSGVTETASRLATRA